MKAQLNNGLFADLPENLIISCGECDGLDIICNCEAGKHLAIVKNMVIIGVETWSGWVDLSWQFPTNFKIKMNSDRFVAMTSEVNAILPDLSNNVSMMGVTEIYLDKVDDELRTLLNYFDGNLVIIERK